MEFDGSEVLLFHLAPDAGRGVTAAHHAVFALVLHGDAGAADHGVELVAHHEFGQCTPQRHDHAAVAVVAVHAAAPQFHHALAHIAQTGQVEFGVAVGAAHATGLGRCEHAVGADHLAGGAVAHQQVFTKVVEQVHVVPGHGVGENGPHLAGKHRVPQSLRFTNLVQVAGPRDFDTTSRGRFRQRPGHQGLRLSR
ncbi:hypothetical protein Y695_03849 [Hydrogenophaga sp. T4]|nr:hypothetical protein Y695_03849 [Hydrogenophaga sp. T4]